MGRKGQKFSEERLLNIRRLRRARYLTKKTPLFAFQIMQSEYEGYSYEQFLDDLRRRSKQKEKKKGRSPLVRYGRYQQMETALGSYHLTGDIEFAIEAQRLRKRMTKPYRILFRCGTETVEYSLSALIPIGSIARLTEQLKTVTNMQQADRLVSETHEIAFLK